MESTRRNDDSLSTSELESVASMMDVSALASEPGMLGAPASAPLLSPIKRVVQQEAKKARTVSWDVNVRENRSNNAKAKIPPTAPVKLNMQKEPGKRERTISLDSNLSVDSTLEIKNRESSQTEIVPAKKGTLFECGRPFKSIKGPSFYRFHKPSIPKPCYEDLSEEEQEDWRRIVRTVMFSSPEEKRAKEKAAPSAAQSNVGAAPKVALTGNSAETLPLQNNTVPSIEKDTKPERIVGKQDTVCVAISPSASKPETESALSASFWNVRNRSNQSSDSDPKLKAVGEIVMLLPP